VAVGIDALKARDDDDLAGVEVGADALVLDARDARLGVRHVGRDRHLPAGVADRRHALGLQRDREQADRDLLAGRRDHVELAHQLGRAALGRDLLGQREQAIRLAAHRRRHDDHAVAGPGPLGDALGDTLDPLGRAHRRAAVLVNDQCHEGGACPRRTAGALAR
jgi:hypothetical protein